VIRRPRDAPGVVLIGLICLLLTSCTTQRAPTVSDGTSPTTTLAAAQQVLHAISTAIESRNRASFDQQIDRRDGAFAKVATRIFDSLTEMPLDSLAFTATNTTGTLTAKRRALLGPTAWVQQVSVSWRVVGDTFPASQQLWLTFSRDDDTPKLAGTTDGSTVGLAQPLWSLDRVVFARMGRASVLAADRGHGDGSAARQWAKVAAGAASVVRQRLAGAVARPWNTDVVVEVPADRQSFERVLGVHPGSYTQIAAVAWPEGPVAARSAIRVIVNPELVRRLDARSEAVLLAHETTHVATRSAASPAPTWLLEGFADYVAYDAYPDTATVAAAGYLARVRQQGAPQQLPRNDRFSPAAPGLNLTYAESWLACRFLADRFSAARLNHFYRAVDGGATVNGALKSEFGLSNREFLIQWGRYLRTAAEKS
jgi:hypothetical protein